LDLAHTQVLLGSVVGEGDAGLNEKREDAALMVAQAPQEVEGSALGGSAAAFSGTTARISPQPLGSRPGIDG